MLRHFLLGWRKLLPRALRFGRVPVVAEVVAFGRNLGVAMAALDSDVESLPRGAFRCCLCHITTANRKRWLVRGWIVVGFSLWVLAKVKVTGHRFCQVGCLSLSPSFSLRLSQGIRGWGKSQHLIPLFPSIRIFLSSIGHPLCAWYSARLEGGERGFRDERSSPSRDGETISML